jgi:hypothetical protein
MAAPLQLGFTDYVGNPEKGIRRLDPNTANEQRVVGQTLGYTADSEAAISSFQMFLRLIQWQRGH